MTKQGESDHFLFEQHKMNETLIFLLRVRQKEYKNIIYNVTNVNWISFSIRFTPRYDNIELQSFSTSNAADLHDEAEGKVEIARITEVSELSRFDCISWSID